MIDRPEKDLLERPERDPRPLSFPFWGLCWTWGFSGTGGLGLANVENKGTGMLNCSLKRNAVNLQLFDWAKYFLAKYTLFNNPTLPATNSKV